VEKDYLILKQAAVSRPSGQWNDDDFDVVANGEVVASLAKRKEAGLNAKLETVSWTRIDALRTNPSLARQ
jgi:hypothetical protein